MPTPLPDYRLVHPLPGAPRFMGRDAELSALRELWQGGFRGVAALVGLGGAGKTAVAARFLDSMLGAERSPRPEGLFVWSFYQEPGADLFLHEAYTYFARGQAPATPARGAGLLHLLRNALAVGGPHLLVLDGLEKVQRPSSSSAGVYGQVEEPLLKGLLTRVAEGTGQTMVLITSRFPLPDLEPFQGHGYRLVAIGGLDRQAARALLRARGVQGEDPQLDGLIADYGAHALTLDHLGTLLGQFLDGDPRRAPELPALSRPESDRQALRLARLLRAYEEHLPPAELALLCRLCLLRRSVTGEQLAQLFLCSPPVHLRTVREFRELARHYPGRECYREADWHELAETIGQTIEEALCSATLAGPEGVFQHELHVVLETALHRYEQAIEVEVGELVQLYSGKDLDAPTDPRPLPAADRGRLRELYERYLELREHPLLPFQQVDPALKSAFESLGWCKTPSRAVADLDPHDVHQALARVQKQLCYLACKHGALQRVRELCRLYQQKWALAGPLAPLDATQLRQVLDALVGRHLALCEGDGSFSIHPAVRDHFSRLAAGAEQGRWHDILREQLVSLVRRPGGGLPEDARTLDLVEEAIHHALEAGRPEEALELYNGLLGGLRHLAWKLGEMARGLRVLRTFNPCPDRWALAWFLRALGELEEAYGFNDFPCFRADLRLLQGRLPEVAQERDDARTAVAAFLMGQTKNLPHEPLGCAVPRAQLLLYRGRLAQTEEAAHRVQLYRDLGQEAERARGLLLLADISCRQHAGERALTFLATAAAWILHSGSVEHLGLYHLVQARVAREAAEEEAAFRAVAEGLHLTRQCGLGLLHIELLCEEAELLLNSGQAPAAEANAREALRRASADDCCFAWGEAGAGHVLARALLSQRRTAEARAVLGPTLELCDRIGDPRKETVARLLRHLDRLA